MNALGEFTSRPSTLGSIQGFSSWWSLWLIHTTHKTAQTNWRGWMGNLCLKRLEFWESFLWYWYSDLQKTLNRLISKWVCCKSWFCGRSLSLGQCTARVFNPSATQQQSAELNYFTSTLISSQCSFMRLLFPKLCTKAVKYCTKECTWDCCDIKAESRKKFGTNLFPFWRQDSMMKHKK